MKFNGGLAGVNRFSRSPHGERGLKLIAADDVVLPIKSLPPRGAWIEIFRDKYGFWLRRVAPPTGSVD